VLKAFGEIEQELCRYPRPSQVTLGRPARLGPSGLSPVLHEAVGTHQFEAVQYSVLQGEPITAVNAQGHGVLTHLVRTYNPAIHDIYETSKIAFYFRRHGGDVNEFDRLWMTPLHHAVFSGSDLTSLLLMMGADASLRTKGRIRGSSEILGLTPFEMAVALRFDKRQDFYSIFENLQNDMHTPAVMRDVRILEVILLSLKSAVERMEYYFGGLQENERSIRSVKAAGNTIH
jgi:hypothetical protein